MAIREVIDADSLDGWAEPCPGCGSSLIKLDLARVCQWCGYYRPAPSPDHEVVGVLGNGDYWILRGRLLGAVRRRWVGEVIGFHWARVMVETFAMELQCNCITTTHADQVAPPSTFIIDLGCAPELLYAARDAGKPIVEIRGRKWPPGENPWSLSRK